MPGGFGKTGYGPKTPPGGGGGGNYPQPPPFPMPGGGYSGGGMTQVNPNLAGQPGQPGGVGYVPPGAGGTSIPGYGATPPAPPNLTQIEANPQLLQMYEKLFAMGGGTDPLLEENLANIRGRMSADTTGRAIDRAGGKITDQLAGALQGNKERAAMRGGGGGEDFGAQALTEGAQRLQAGAAADISLGRERDLDALAMGALPSYAAPGQRAAGYYGAAAGAAGSVASNQLGGANQALQAWQTQMNQQLQQQQLAQQQQMAMLNMYQSLWG